MGTAAASARGLGGPHDGMHVSVVSPERALYDGGASALVAPAYDGEVGILPRHAPFVTLLGKGTLVIRTAAGPQRFRVEGGFLQVVADRVRVVAERADVL
jgi:F-type H+-transporting ATPase subunit epsilon